MAATAHQFPAMAIPRRTRWLPPDVAVTAARSWKPSGASAAAWILCLADLCSRSCKVAKAVLRPDALLLLIVLLCMQPALTLAHLLPGRTGPPNGHSQRIDPLSTAPHQLPTDQKLLLPANDAFKADRNTMSGGIGAALIMSQSAAQGISALSQDAPTTLQGNSRKRTRRLLPRRHDRTTADHGNRQWFQSRTRRCLSVR